MLEPDASPDSLHWIKEALSVLKFPFFAFIGCFALYVLNRLNGIQPFSVLKAFNVSVNTKSKPIVVLADITASSVLGCIVVVLLTNPTTSPQAIAAGLGLTGILSASSRPGGAS